MRYNVSSDVLVSTRALLVNAAAERIDAEKRIGSLNDNKLRTIEAFAKHAAHADAFTLGYLATHGTPVQDGILSHRRSNAMCNVYALSKILVTARGMNGGVVLGDIGDAMTIAGVVFALAAGITEGKRIANAVNDYANSLIAGRTYSSGGTQSSSTLRALELFGIVRKGGGNTWHIADTEGFSRMLDACKGVYATAPADDASDAPMPAPAPSDGAWDGNGVTLEGECCDVTDAELAALASELASLPAPAPMLALAYAGSDVQGDAEGEASPAPATPAKGKGKRKNK